MKRRHGVAVLVLALLTTTGVARSQRTVLETAYPELRCQELVRLIESSDTTRVPKSTQQAAKICATATSLADLSGKIDAINRGILELAIPAGLGEEELLSEMQSVMPETQFLRSRQALILAFRGDPAGMRGQLVDMAIDQHRTLHNTNAEDVPGVGGLAWQSQIIEGITAFLVERSKAEAMFSLVSRLRKEVCVESPDVAKIFTNTCALLAATEGSTTLPTFGSTWKAAFQQDLQGILPNLLSEEIPEHYRPILRGAIDVLQEIFQGADPLEALVELKSLAPIKDKDTGEWNCDPKKPALWVALIGRYVREHYTVAEVGKRKTMKPPTDLTLKDTFEKCPTLAYRKEAIPELASLLKRVERQIKSLRERLEDEEEDLSRAERASLYSRYLESVFSAYAEFSELVPSNSPCDEKCRKGYKAWVEAVRIAFDIQGAITHSDYGQVVVKATVLLQKLDDLTGDSFAFPNSFYRIANLAADVASAPTAAEVKQAIEAAAIPVGGFRIKRGAGNRFRGFSAYVGLAVGQERLEENMAQMTESLDSNHYGVWAPVGFEFSWGTGKKASNGVFLSAIDVGAILSYRFSSDSENVEDAPEVGFKQIVSPGLFYVRGQGPVTFGLGVQVSPALRRVTSAGVEVEEDALRYSFTVALDIPLFQF